MKRKTNNLTNRAAWDKLPRKFELVLDGEGLTGSCKVVVVKVESNETKCVWSCALEIYGNSRAFKLGTFKLRDFGRNNIEQCMIVSDFTPNPFADETGAGLIGSLSYQLHEMVKERGKLKSV